ncbi:phosphatase PAP2 family protein [Deinococcus sp. Marseille-Q6407]|uniref:phosphatase PAP2 family protein n=1 Tax=Deinococcus sp. Marseille-Q6407 TaxID=2969223 RepID=UPI0021BE7BA4|nr:phosphatase PAP2 family protein [Deinococcus sp. Marseille-Q6407]
MGKLGDSILENERFRFETPWMLAAHERFSAQLDSLAVFLHFWGGTWVMAGLLLLLIAWAWTTLGRRAALFTLLGPGSAVATGSVLKFTFDRPRPELWPRLVQEHSASFPSGHATMSAALATWLVLLLWPTRWRWPAVVIGVLYAGAMGFSRILLGVHYPTDVLAGWLTGLAIVLGVFRLLRQPLWRREAAQR